LALAGPAAAITPAGGNGVNKDRGFSLTPPWSHGKTFSMTCGYGCGKHDNVGTQDHFALDISMPGGEPVYAAAAGRVILAEALGGGWEPYGNAVLIDHFNGYMTFYAHLDTLAVAAGTEVDSDTQIGTAGQSGSGASTDHLHFVVYKGAALSGSPGARGPAGGQAVVPEPFSHCTKSAGGDCEDLVAVVTLRRDDYGIKAVVHPDRSLDVFTCGRTSRNLLTRQRSAVGVWGGWTNLLGTCAGSPTAVRDASGRVYVFVRGLDGKLYHKRRDTLGGAWTDWGTPLDGPILERPAAALDTVSGVLRVFARRGPDHALYYASQSGLGFTAWTRLGGRVVNAPVAGTRADGRVDAYVAGIDYNLWKMPALAGGTYQAENWATQSVSIEGEPDLVPEGTLEWAVRTTGDQLVRQPSTVVTAATHPPAVSRNLNGLLHAFRRNRSNSNADAFYQDAFGSWQTVPTFGGLVTSELEAVRAGSGDRILMFTWGTSGLYYREQSSANSTTGWGGWVDMTVPN
jgi:hypothetical protein